MSTSLEDCNGLDQILKNTEFENSQQVKAIESEREKIQVYEKRIEECQSQMNRLEEQMSNWEEQAAKLSKQSTINKENIDNLKRTSTVLSEHEEALKKKLQRSLDEVNCEMLQQASDLAKYEAIWATYEAKYESMEEVQKIRRKKDELNSIKEQNEATKTRIEELQQLLKAMHMKKGNERSLVSCVIRMASLRVETDKNACEIQADLLKSLSLKARIREMYKQSALMEHQTVCQVPDSMESIDVAHSCVEPMERAVEPREEAQQPLSTTLASEKTFFDNPPFSNTVTSTTTTSVLAKEHGHFTHINSRIGANQTKHISEVLRDVVPLKTISAPRYRLELPQLSNSSRRNRNELSTSSLIGNVMQYPSTAYRVCGSTSNIRPTSSLSNIPISSLAVQSVSQHIGSLQLPEKQQCLSALAQPKPSPLQVAYTSSSLATKTNLVQTSKNSSLEQSFLHDSAAVSIPQTAPNDLNNFQFKVPSENPFRQKILSFSNGTSAPVQGQSQVGDINRESENSKGHLNENTEYNEQERSSRNQVSNLMSAESMEWSDHSWSAKNPANTEPNITYQTMVPPSSESMIASASQQQMAMYRSREEELQIQGENFQPSVTMTAGVALPAENYWDQQVHQEVVQKVQPPNTQDLSNSQDNMFNNIDDRGFSFGGFGQESGSYSGGFGGGFGFFDGQQESGSGVSSFGSSFSFGGTSSPRQNSGGFNLNFGENSDPPGSFSIFNF